MVWPLWISCRRQYCWAWEPLTYMDQVIHTSVNPVHLAKASSLLQVGNKSLCLWAWSVLWFFCLWLFIVLWNAWLFASQWSFYNLTKETWHALGTDTFSETKCFMRFILLGWRSVSNSLRWVCKKHNEQSSELFLWQSLEM